MDNSSIVKRVKEKTLKALGVSEGKIQYDQMFVFASFAFIFVLVFLQMIFSVYPDLLFTYPHFTFDSYQWVNDGLFYLGHPITPVLRAPFLPFLNAFLHLIASPALLPVLQSALLFVFSFYLYKFIRLFFEKTISVLPVLIIFLSYRFHTQFDYVLADHWAITFQLISFYYFLKIKSDIRYFIPFGVFAAFSFMTQYNIAFLAFAFIYYIVREIVPTHGINKRTLKVFLIALLCGAFLTVPFFLFRWIAYDNPLFSQVIHFPLLRTHFFGVFFYSVNYLAYFGILFALLAVFGFFKKLSHKSTMWSFVYVAFIIQSAFWFFNYKWVDNRFILYIVPFVALFLAAGFKSLSEAGFVLSLKNTLVKNIVVLALFLYALLLAMHPSGTFTRNELPISPQNVLRFTHKAITEYQGNVAIGFPVSLHYETESFPSTVLLTRYYRMQKSVDTNQIVLRDELRKMKNLLDSRFAGKEYRLSAVEQFYNYYYDHMKMEYVFRRDLVSPGGEYDAIIATHDFPVPNGFEEIHSGRFYKMYVRK